MSKSQKLLLEHYPVPVIEELGSQYGFNANDTKIRHLLGKALSALYRNSMAKEAREIAKANRAHLKKALDHLERLESSVQKIEGLDSYIFLDDILKRYEPTAKIQTDNPIATSKLEREFLDSSLAVVRKVLQDNLEALMNKGGRPRNKGLQGFTEYMWMLWADELGRPFTLDYHRGSGTSQAFQFVNDMLAPAYDATESEIINAMRYVIAKKGHT
tara:strand:+ start:1503 stop:2147 length:645 start_codon:yes stop_codon:yes gene_type:complete